jgi:aspartate kinase
VSFTVARADAAQAEELVREAARELGGGAVEVDHSIAKVSIVGVGMRAHAGVAAEMFQALHDGGVNIAMITTSEIKVTCVIAKDKVKDAVKALHARFELHSGGKLASNLEPPSAVRKNSKPAKKAPKKKTPAKRR